MRIVALMLLLGIALSSIPAGAAITFPTLEGYPDCHSNS
jgi:hypothetical protein